MYKVANQVRLDSRRGRIPPVGRVLQAQFGLIGGGSGYV